MGVESGHKCVVFVEKPVKPLLPLVPVSAARKRTAWNDPSRLFLVRNVEETRARTHAELPLSWNGRVGQVSLSRVLGDLAQCGSQQGGIDGSCTLERFGVDRDVDQGIEPAY